MGANNFCENCGQPLGEGEKFCKNCGAPVRSNMESEQSESKDTQRTSPSRQNIGVSSQNTAPMQTSQNSGGHRGLIIAAFAVCIIVAFIIGIFVGRSMNNDTETTESIEKMEETPDTTEEQSADVQGEEEKEEVKEEETQPTADLDDIYYWSVSDGLELTTLEVVTRSDETTLHMELTNNTSSTIVIGWSSAAQMDITDVEGNEYYAHFPTHVEIYASDTQELDLQASGEIEAQIAKIEIEDVNYLQSNGLPQNIGGSTVTFTVEN